MGRCAKKKFTKLKAKIILAFKPDHRGECRYYWCPECNAYHLTSQPRRGKRDDMQARGFL